MANKDLIRRALSVTANLPSAAQEEAAKKNNLTTPQSTITDANDAPLQPASRIAPLSTPRTGPGSMMAFMTEQSEVHKEVVELRAKIADIQGADMARRLDPNTIGQSVWANRNEAHFATEAFASLKREIAAAGGNVQPIKVRRNANTSGESKEWEIVFGHRRHRACLELGMPVLALIQQSMKDSELFVEMERENREREDLSAWEQGVMYVRALEQGLFPSAKQMAAAIDRDMGNISRAMALAKLPNEVVSAFGSPLNLQFRWASPLKEAHQADPERLLTIARELVARETRPKPIEVFSLLTKRLNSDADPVIELGNEEWKDEKGRSLARMSNDRRGRPVISFNQPLNAIQKKKLCTFLDALLAIKR